MIWVVVAGLNAATIIAFSEGAEQDKAFRPIALGLLVPPLVYAAVWLWNCWKARRKPKSVPDPD